MRLLFLSSLGIMCSCSAPKLETNGIIGCWIFDGGSIKHEFDYPSDTRSRQLLFCAWISAGYKNAIKFLHGFPNSLMVHELLNAGMRRMDGSA